MPKVCVQGLGFVGAAMAAAVANARGADGEACFNVVGVDLPTVAGAMRIAAINSGRFPFETTDAALDEAVQLGRSIGNLRASSDPSEYETADIVVVDVHLDVDFSATPPAARLAGFIEAIRTLGQRVSAGVLMIVETTVPPGTTSKIVLPEIQRCLRERGMNENSVLVAHSYERVMPGCDYLRSITNFWRVYAGATDGAADACEAFLRKIINTGEYPLTRLKQPIESETAKLMENSFRAANIAFIDEWARFAERTGIDLGAVVAAIRMRPTHRNIMHPGFGVGGYCLTKDPLLPGVGAREVLGIDDLAFPFCEAAVATNQKMPRATLTMLTSTLGSISGKRILLLGASYREDVADTRYSPSASFVIWAEEQGATVDVQDPLVDTLDDVARDVNRVLSNPDGYDAVVFAVAHKVYRLLAPPVWLGRERPLILDANMVLTPAQIGGFLEAGCAVKVIGRGDL